MSCRCPAKKAFLLPAALIIVWLGGFILFFSFVTSLKPPAESLYSEAAIVLTGGPHRINAGFDLLEAGSTNTVFISGVDQRVTEEMLVSLWRNDAEATPLPCCIVLGHVAKNTAENAIEAARWIKDNDIASIRLITSEYHIPRAWLEFSESLPETEILIHPVKSEESLKNFFRLAFLEYNKILLTFFRHLTANLRND